MRFHDPTNDFIPMAQVQLARAYVLQNDTVKARTAYQDFLALWKDADPEVPVYKEAKIEYAKLQYHPATSENKLCIQLKEAKLEWQRRRIANRTGPGYKGSAT